MSHKMSMCLQALLPDETGLCSLSKKGSLVFIWCVFISVLEVHVGEARGHCILGRHLQLAKEACSHLPQFYVPRGHCVIY